MSEKKLKVDSEDDDEDDDDYCPIKTVNEQSDPSDESGHEDDDEKDQDEQIDSEKQNDLNIKPYDESKTNELWKNFTSSTKPSSTTTDNTKAIVEKPKPAVESPKPATKIFEYAGEKVAVPVTSTAISPSLKRPAASSSTANSLLDRLGIGKKQKLSTLEKSRLDWSTHKESEALTDDLNSHRRGKDSYVEKTAFLQRTESREHDNYLTRLKKK
jgi:hypothetical protein